MKLIKKALTFDDVQLLDGLSDCQSRSDINLMIKDPNVSMADVRNYHEYIPIFIAPMITVNSHRMANFAYNNKIVHVLHRYMPVPDQLNWLDEAYSFAGNLENFGDYQGVAIGLNTTLEQLQILQEYVRHLVFDVAACNNTQVIEWLKSMKGRLRDDTILTVGNFSDVSFIQVLANEGLLEDNYINFLKVSQGGGSVCQTRLKTGVGKPTFQATLDAYQFLCDNGLEDQVEIIADGGIRGSADICKAIGAGATGVMMGSYFAGYKNNNPDCFVYNEAKEVVGIEYFGMASAKAKQLAGRKVKNVEGTNSYRDIEGSEVLQQKLEDTLESIQSSLSLQGFEDWSEAIGEGTFVEVTQNGVKEASTHGV